MKRVTFPTTKLLAWYQRHKRDLPWRRTTDPYKIWVSEIMLQQTQVETVIPFYQRFLKRFPTMRSLTKASLHDVLKQWEGLGYYARARNLHKAAKIVTQTHGGRLPHSADALRALPGIGQYASGAVASIAFGESEPVLDGNVARVLCRHFAIRSSPKLPGTQKELWAIAASLVPSHGAGDFNQALMELGAMVCVPSGPNCPVCPLAVTCRAKRLRLQDQLPIGIKKPPLPHKQIAAGVIWKNGQFLIAQRPLNGLLGGLWEFPGGKQERGETLPQCLRREIKEELGIDIEVRKKLLAVDHAYTHFKITLHAFDCLWKAGQPRKLQVADWRWVKLPQARRFAFPAANHVILKCLEQKA